MAYSKTALRQKLIKLRQEFSVDFRKRAAEAAAEIFLKTPHFSNHQHFACYHAQKSEMDTAPLINKIWGAKKQCYLPVINTPPNKVLQFVHYEPHSQLKKNDHKIFEPIASQEISLHNLEVIIAPLLGFDLQGNRLGMGLGYYDHTLSYLYEQNKKKCIYLGLAYAIQCVDRIQADIWDIPLDGVITEQQFICLSRL